MTLQEEITISTDGVLLRGTLIIPEDTKGIVLFAHGSGSSRFSPRNQCVASELQSGSITTLLMDLLTAQEETIDLQTRELRFDIPLLARRLEGATDWLFANPKSKGFPIGYFGSSTGAAAALIAAANKNKFVKAVVSRGGRPDLARNSLPKVQAPTLLIVGGNDYPVIDLNQQAYDLLQCEKKMEIVPGATHLFEEPGTLEQVAKLAKNWFIHHLS
jgi:putative phosphoribosyl transferase